MCALARRLLYPAAEEDKLNDLKSLVVPFLMITGWFAIALATLVQLADMGGTLVAMDKAEQARQASVHATRVALAAPRCPAE